MSKDRLELIIQALNQSEKRYFKQLMNRHSTKKSSSILIQFFDYLSHTKNYSPTETLLKCPFIKPEQLQNIKVRLYDAILSSLRLYHANSSPEIELHQHLINHEILKNKRLYEQAWKTLTKGEVLAREHEHYSLHETILDKQEHLATIRLKKKNVKQIQTEIKEKRTLISTYKTQLNTLNHIQKSLYQIFKTEGRVLRTTEYILKTENLLHQLELNFDTKITSFNINFLLHKNYSLGYQLTANFSKAANHLKELQTLFENPKMRLYKPIEYQRTLNASLIIANEQKKDAFGIELIAAIRAQPKQLNDNKDYQLLVFENALFQEIEIHLQQRNFSTATTLIENNLDQINFYRNDIHTVNQQSKFYRIALAYFGDKQFKKALKWTNQIINLDEIKYRKDILASVRLLNLLLHFELGNKVLLRNLLQTTRNFLKKIDRLLAPELALIKTLNKIINTNESKTEVFKNLQNNLTEIENDNLYNRHSFAYFSLKEWTIEKINTK